jgi:selenocysteine lyase/cysteine desulfurase
MNSLEQYFEKFRRNIIGNDLEYPFNSGKKKILYADWAASGRLYRPIEEYISNTLGPYMANTHTETTLTGTMMTHAYHQAHEIIKKHVNASPDDQLLFVGSGMTAAVNKFQRLLGLRVPEKYIDSIRLPENNRPLVIITHMEHHSNQTTWVECLCDVAIINRDKNGLPDLNHLHEILEANKNRKLIIGSFSACSNVSGILTPYHQMAEIVHEYRGYCFVDFSASAPYVEINMHPEKENQELDAIFFSPHKFLGGPGSSGVILFHKSLYHNSVPDHPGGGTVTWTNPWGEQHYFEDIEIREDGGTPGFLQGIKASLTILLKEKMGIRKMQEREHHLKERMMERLANIPQVVVLEAQQKHRLGFISFYTKDIHHNLIVRLLNDRFGIQTRGGCSCAGTYGHILLNINYDESHRITDMIDIGDLSHKPGWVRISLHPTLRDDEVEYIADSLEEILNNHLTWEDDYRFDIHTGDFEPINPHQQNINIRKSFHCV